MAPTLSFVYGCSQSRRMQKGWFGWVSTVEGLGYAQSEDHYEEERKLARTGRHDVIVEDVPSPTTSTTTTRRAYSNPSIYSNSIATATHNVNTFLPPSTSLISPSFSPSSSSTNERRPSFVPSAMNRKVHQISKTTIDILGILWQVREMSRFYSYAGMKGSTENDPMTPILIRLDAWGQIPTNLELILRHSVPGYGQIRWIGNQVLILRRFLSKRESRAEDLYCRLYRCCQRYLIYCSAATATAITIGNYDKNGLSSRSPTTIGTLIFDEKQQTSYSKKQQTAELVPNAPKSSNDGAGGVTVTDSVGPGPGVPISIAAQQPQQQKGGVGKSAWRSLEYDNTTCKTEFHWSNRTALTTLPHVGMVKDLQHKQDKSLLDKDHLWWYSCADLWLTDARKHDLVGSVGPVLILFNFNPPHITGPHLSSNQILTSLASPSQGTPTYKPTMPSSPPHSPVEEHVERQPWLPASVMLVLALKMEV